MDARGGGEDGALVQSVGIAFLVLRIGVVLLALTWLSAGVRPIPPGSQAVVQRFGRIDRVRPSGLLWAWPRPVETVTRLPSAERQTILKVAAGSARVSGLLDPLSTSADVPEDAGAYLTGDGAVVLLEASLVWRISDAAAYALAEPHVPAALRRLFMDAATQVAAARQLDDFLAARPERAADPAAQTARNAVRGDLTAAVNAGLARLAAAGAGLGVEVVRTDVTALLPPTAKTSYDAVLDATQRAEQGLAAARTDATRIGQQAERGRDAVLTAARAQAEERLAKARSSTATISALEAGMDPATRAGVLDQLYRDRIGPIMAQAGATSAVDPGIGRLILPGGPTP